MLLMDHTMLACFRYVFRDGDLICVSRDLSRVHEGTTLRFTDMLHCLCGSHSDVVRY